MEILEDGAYEAAQSKVKVNSNKSNIMTLSFLKSKPSFKTPIPNEIINTKTKLFWNQTDERFEMGGPHLFY